jgi:hypothetical protein
MTVGSPKVRWSFSRRSVIIRFRATGITAYLSDGGALEHAQEGDGGTQVAAHHKALQPDEGEVDSECSGTRQVVVALKVQ